MLRAANQVNQLADLLRQRQEHLILVVHAVLCSAAHQNQLTMACTSEHTMQRRGAEERTREKRQQLFACSLLIQGASDGGKPPNRVQTQLHILVLQLVQQDLDRI